MPHLRRLTAVLVHLLLIHLAVAGAWSACPMGADTMAASMPSTAALGAHPLDASSPARHHREMPAPNHDRQRTDGCQASCVMLSCAGVGHCASWTEREGDRIALVDAGVRPRLASAQAGAPLSDAAAPEPPPPRA